MLQDENARNEAYPNLPEPYRIQGVLGKKIKFVASGSAAAHIICIDMEGKLFAWGRNEVRVALRLTMMYVLGSTSSLLISCEVCT